MKPLRHIALVFLLLVPAGQAQQRVLVLFEGADAAENLGRGDAFQLAQLMGHFKTRTDVRSVERYTSGEMEAYDVVSFVGYTLR